METNLTNDKLKDNINFESNSNIRDSGLEILRIIAMFFIVMHHSVMFSGVFMPIDLNYKLTRLLEMGGKLGVNVFVLISGYFLISKRFSLKRILNILLQTFIVSFVIYLIFAISGYSSFSLKNIIYNLFPVLFGKWWFATTYIVLLLIMPGLNLIIHNLNRKMHKMICLSSVLLIVFVPYINLLIAGAYKYLTNFNDLIWFIVLYFLAAYFRLYNPKIDKFKVVILLIFSITYQIIATLISIYELEIYSVCAIGNILISLSLFYLFKDMKFKNKFINTVASTTFGIYLIHEHNLIRGWWWKWIFGIVNGVVDNYFLTFLVDSIITFVLCLVIYFVYLKLVHKVLIRQINKIICNNRKQDRISYQASKE